METSATFVMLLKPRFEVLFLEGVRKFLAGLDEKTRTKIIRMLNDPKLFKKLNGEVWEFRTKFNGLQYRLLAFWDKTGPTTTVVISTHGFVKKTDGVSSDESSRAEKLRRLYFEQKKNETKR